MDIHLLIYRKGKKHQTYSMCENIMNVCNNKIKKDNLIVEARNIIWVRQRVGVGDNLISDVDQDK